MALSMPDGVSTVRGGALPARAAFVTVFGMTPPSLAKSTNGTISFAYPNVPDATRTGLRRTSRPRVVERSIGEEMPAVTAWYRPAYWGGRQRVSWHPSPSPGCEGESRP